MSNSNNILSGLFRSISRRSQHRSANAEENNLPPRADVDMESQQPNSPASTGVSTTSSTVVRSSAVGADGNHSDSSMPPLEDVSDSEASDVRDLDSEDDNEDQGFHREVGNNGDSQLPQPISGRPVVSSADQDEDMPPLESIRPQLAPLPSQGTRRTRVEDDVDGDSERDRRHPSQRTLSISSESSPDPVRSAHPDQTNEHSHRPAIFSNFLGGAPGVGIGVAGILPPNPHRRSHQHHLLPVHLMPQMGLDVRANTSQTGNPELSNSGPLGNNVDAQGQNANNEQPHGAVPATFNGFPAFLQSLIQAAGNQPGVAFTTSFNGVPVGNTMPNTDVPNGGNGDFLGNLFTAMSGMQGGGFTFNASPGGIPFFGFRPAQEREDPERAKVLVDGLEQVPVGLMRRLERVSPESSGCAICWEKLLEQDAEYLSKEEEEQEAEDVSKAGVNNLDSNESMGASSNTAHNNTSTSTRSPSSSASKADSTKNKVPKYPRIVTLPCSHVFHADCLIPWFSRPRQTTCPTCRFNIDPDDLTRGIGARRRAAASAAARGRGAEGVAGEDAMLSAPPRMDGIRLIDPATGLPVPSGDNVQGVPFFSPVNGGGSGEIFVPFQPPPPAGMTGGGFFSTFPSGAAGTPRTASNQNVNNTQGSTPRSNNITSSTTPSRSEMGTHRTNSSSNINASTPAANNADIDPATLIPPGAPRLTRRQLWFEEDHQLRNPVFESFLGPMFLSTGQPDDNTGAQAGTPSAQANPPFNNALQNPVHTPHVHPHPFMHPQGNMPHHPHHAGDSYVSIGFDFILSPNAPPLDPGGVNPPQVGAPGNPAQNGASTMGVDHSSSTPNSNNPHATPDNIPHQADGGEPITSRNSVGAELSNQDMHGVELHGFGVNFGGFDSGSINEEGLMELEFTGRTPQENQEGTHGSLASPDALITGNDFGAPITLPSVRLSNTRAGPNISAANQQPGAQRPGSADSTVNADAQPNSNASPRLPDLSGYLNSMFGTAVPGTNGPRRGQFAIRRGGNRSQSAARGGSRVQSRSPWALPPPPGLTLRQTIERREREAGLRCWDVSCGLAPDDDCPYREIPDERKRQVKIRQEASASSSQENEDSKGKGKEKADGDPEPKYVCGHTFHTPCLVTAQRVALNGAEEVIVEEGKSVEVSCPICRAIGVLLREDWEDGVRALETDLD